MRIRTKICGMTRSEDVQLAADLGVDAIGLIFYAGSRRCIDIPQAQKLVQSLPPLMSVVALFVNPTDDEVNKVLAKVPVNILQFHGNESAAFCRQFHRPYLKAIRVENRASIEAVQRDYPDARALLFDAAVTHQYGGTGQTFDWQYLPDSLSCPWILSGGLKPDNVAQAIRQTGAVALDLCSGVEERPGIKDPARMRALMQAVNAVAASSIN
ncbi:phosphoribosylanthranilate isomerase [Neisseriaceae bacterium ESL0693]|nr:phosphoribosylanthranilate isomerase [Neisseriaceae bacterium ESL0693]